MFPYRNRRSGNKFTLAVILMVLCIVYIIGGLSPRKEAGFPVQLQYNGYSYQYTGTQKAMPFSFKRGRPSSAGGFLILARRGRPTTQEIYIYEGSMRYRRYQVLDK